MTAIEKWTEISKEIFDKTQKSGVLCDLIATRHKLVEQMNDLFKEFNNQNRNHVSIFTPNGIVHLDASSHIDLQKAYNNLLQLGCEECFSKIADLDAQIQKLLQSKNS